MSLYAASRAQDTVPEEKVMTPVFSPFLMPETTTSGSCGRRDVRDILTHVPGGAGRGAKGGSQNSKSKGGEKTWSSFEASCHRHFFLLDVLRSLGYFLFLTY